MYAAKCQMAVIPFHSLLNSDQPIFPDIYKSKHQQNSASNWGHDALKNAQIVPMIKFSRCLHTSHFKFSSACIEKYALFFSVSGI